MRFHNVALPFLIAAAARVAGEMTLHFSTKPSCGDETALGAVVTIHQDQEITFTNHVYRSVLQFTGAKSTCQLAMSYDGTTAEPIPEFSSVQPAPTAEKRDTETVVVICSIYKNELNESLALTAVNVHGC
ncbi:hypothetical protein PG993_009560 [Apiospora rasikravindrae]|uniref:AA1-like domain-containing protein n=1 Tax=Apiospora rasikravindrae TaxID=990691 RepID=A0ABR1SLG3_9PEZI